MRVLVLGHGKTGKLVAQVAAEHGHSVHVLDAKENKDAAALTAPFVAGFDVVIDFTTPEAAVQNMRACLANGAKMVVGTTGWYDKLPDMRGLAERRAGRPALRHQLLHRRAGHAAARRADGRRAQGRRLHLRHRRDAPRLQARRALRHRHQRWARPSKAPPASCRHPHHLQPRRRRDRRARARSPPATPTASR